MGMGLVGRWRRISGLLARSFRASGGRARHNSRQRDEIRGGGSGLPPAEPPPPRTARPKVPAGAVPAVAREETWRRRF